MPAIFVALVSVMAFTSFNHRKKEILSFLFFFLFSFYNFNLRSEHLEYFNLQNYLNSNSDYILEIVNEPRKNPFFQSEFIVELKSKKFNPISKIRENFLPYRFFARADYALGLDKGDRLKLTDNKLYKKGRSEFELKKLSLFKAKALKREKVFYELKNKNLSFDGHSESFITELQDYIKNHFLSTMSESNAFIVSSLLMGTRVASLPEDFVANVRLLGLGHFFAASGFHLLILTLFIAWLLSKSSFPEKIKTLLSLSFVFLYSALAGFSPSIIRAGIFISSFLILKLFNRKLLSLKFLFLLAGFVLFIDPYTIFDIGFQFSYLATLGILLWTKPVKEKITAWIKIPKFAEYFFEIIYVTISVQIIVLPFVIYYFGTLQLWSILANVLLTPFLSLLLLMSFLGLSFILEPLLNSFKFLLTYIEYLPGIKSEAELSGTSLFLLIFLFNYLATLIFLDLKSLKTSAWWSVFLQDKYLRVSISFSIVFLLFGINLEAPGLKKIELRRSKFQPKIIQEYIEDSSLPYKYLNLADQSIKALIVKDLSSIKALGDLKNDLREIHLLIIPKLRAGDIYLDTLLHLLKPDFVMIGAAGTSKRAQENLKIIGGKAHTILASGELYISSGKFWKITN
jgi:ComEC/Rec2-related protein